MKLSSSYPISVPITTNQTFLVILVLSCSIHSPTHIHTTMYQHTESNPHFTRQQVPQLPYDQNFLPPSPQVQQIRPHGRRTQILTPDLQQPQSKDNHPQSLEPHKDQSSPPSDSRPSHRQHHDRHTQSYNQQRPQSDHPHGPRIQPDRPTNPYIWFGAVFCAILWIVIIVGGLIVLIIYLVFRPRSPGFDISSVTLNAAYLDMGSLLNADVTLLANFTNPNKKVRVDYSYMYINLYYGSTLISTQYIEPFSATKAESKFAYIHMVTSQVRLPREESLRLQKQMENNGVILEVKGFFRARSNLGSILRYSYWLHCQCNILTAGPPDGVLIKRKCKTKH